MKKVPLLILLILLFTVIPFIITSCGDDGDTPQIKGTVTLNVYNWGEYIADGFEGGYDTNAEFVSYFNANLAEKYGTKIEVNYTTYATNEDMYSKLSSGAGEGVYDVIFPSDYMLQRMADEGLLHEFDVAAEIENYESCISSEFRNLYYDENERYSVPYTYGMVGIIYNPTLMDEDDLDENGEIKEASWALLWNDQEKYNGDYSGKILQFNNPRDAFGTAMYYNKLDINSTDKSVWETALESLKTQKPMLQGYVNDEIFNKMTSASAAIAPYFAGDYITMLDDNEDLRFYYPEEGTNVFVDAMCIPESSTKKEYAKEYINFMLMKDAAIANALYIGYASPNMSVYEDAYYKETIGDDSYEILYGQSVDDIKSTYGYDPYYHSFTESGFDKDMQFYVNGLWEQLKTSTDIEAWVHVSSITIVVVLLAVCTYSVYIKKKRSAFYRHRDREKMKANRTNN